MKEKSIDGSYYFVYFTNYYSKYRKVYFLKHKSEVVIKFEELLCFLQKSNAEDNHGSSQ